MEMSALFGLFLKLSRLDYSKCPITISDVKNVKPLLPGIKDFMMIQFPIAQLVKHL